MLLQICALLLTYLQRKDATRDWSHVVLSLRHSGASQTNDRIQCRPNFLLLLRVFQVCRPPLRPQDVQRVTLVATGAGIARVSSLFYMSLAEDQRHHSA
jgi:hypothetical protein